MKIIVRLAILLLAVVLQGCGYFSVSDSYGNTYGGFFDYGNKYLWQMATCEADPGLVEAPASDRQRWMQCCMWRHGVPVEDPNGCAAPPYYKG
jgi:hypothetical protein